MLSFEKGYEAALEDGVWVRRPPALRLIRITGEQRIWFLQNTVTADLEDLADGSWRGSCFLDVKGRVVATFRVGVLSDEVWLDVEPPGGDGLRDWFVKYRFRTKVGIDEREISCRTVLGGAAEPGVLVRNGDGLQFTDAFGDTGVRDLHGGPTMDELPEAPAEVYNTLRIEAARPAFGVDYSTRDLPQEAGLTRLVSVEKGCYVGQETIARIHFRGHVNKVVRSLRFDGAVPPAGSELRYEGSKVGKVTSVAVSPRRGAIGLGMVRVEPMDDAELEIDGGGTARVGPVPEGTKIKIG